MTGYFLLLMNQYFALKYCQCILLVDGSQFDASHNGVHRCSKLVKVMKNEGDLG